MSFSKWLDDPASWPASEPVSLIEISTALHSAFDGCDLDLGEWLEARKLYLETLVRRGLRPMFPNYETGTWEWTDRFNGFEGDDNSPGSIADAALQSWDAFGDSGGAEHLRFGTQLSSGPLPERGPFL